MHPALANVCVVYELGYCSCDVIYTCATHLL